MLPGGFFQSAVRHAKRSVEPWGCGDVASVSRKGVRGHGKPDQMSLPMARSVSSSSSFLTRSGLPILMAGIFCRSVGPVDRRLRRSRVARDLRNAHEAVGQVVRFGCRGGSRSPYLRPGILAAFGAIIRYSLLCRKRVAWHLEDRLSWDGLPSSRLASGALGSQVGPRSRVFST